MAKAGGAKCGYASTTRPEHRGAEAVVSRASRRGTITGGMQFRFWRLAILSLAVSGIAPAQPASDFAGTWVLKSNGQAIFKLVLTTDGDGIKGALTKPSQLAIDQDGDITKIGPEQETLPVQKARLDAGRLELTIDDDQFVMTLENRDHASLRMPGIRPWRLERVPNGSSVVLATRLPEPDYSPDIRALREQLKQMVKEDQDARFAFDDARMEGVDTKNRAAVLRMFERYGWITNSLAGKDAAHDFWLLVQHQAPEIQQRLLPALEKAAKSGEASMTGYAFLYDRVQTGLGKPQRWGTQVKCENGKPVLFPVDDPAGLDTRRKELFLQPIAEYLKVDYIVQSCAHRGK